MILPTQQQCLDFFKEHHVPDNIFRHCCKVQEVANFIASQMQDRRIKVDTSLVNCLSILHDLFKMIAIKDFGRGHHRQATITPTQKEYWKKMQEKYPNIYEGELAFLFFHDQYPELASSLKNVSNPRYDHHTWEELIVHYADLRVLQEEVVTLPQRFAYLRVRYPRDEKVWQDYEQKLKKQEAKIQPMIAFNLNQLKKEMENSHDR